MICPCKGIPFRFCQFGKCSRVSPPSGRSRPSSTGYGEREFTALAAHVSIKLDEALDLVHLD